MTKMKEEGHTSTPLISKVFGKLVAEASSVWMSGVNAAIAVCSSPLYCSTIANWIALNVPV
jgi:hypothetical protein